MKQNAHGDSELDSDNDTIDTSRIEPTTAEAEAIAKGLQVLNCCLLYVIGVIPDILSCVCF